MFKKWKIKVIGKEQYESVLQSRKIKIFFYIQLVVWVYGARSLWGRGYAAPTLGHSESKFEFSLFSQWISFSAATRFHACKTSDICWQNWSHFWCLHLKQRFSLKKALLATVCTILISKVLNLKNECSSVE